MPDVTVNQTLAGGGVSIDGNLTRSPDSANGLTPTLPVAVAGTLSTRTDNDTGVVTAVGHGLVPGDKVDIYWSGGRRYNMIVSAVAGNDVTVGTAAGDVGAGDNFPAAATAVTIAKQVRSNVSIDGDLVSLLALQLYYAGRTSAGKGHVSFYDAANALITHLDLTPWPAVQIYDITGGHSNPFTGNPITYLMATNGFATEAATLKLIVGQDSTP